MDHNQFALHTTPGCFKADEIPGTQTGQTLEGDCSTPRGCIVAETKPNSFGPAFAAAGGGVYAVQIAESGVFQWFWSVRVHLDIFTMLMNLTVSEETGYSCKSASYHGG